MLHNHVNIRSFQKVVQIPIKIEIRSVWRVLVYMVGDAEFSVAASWRPCNVLWLTRANHHSQLFNGSEPLHCLQLLSAVIVWPELRKLYWF